MNREKLINSFIVLLFPIIMIFILAPVEIYYSNITDFDFLYTDFIGTFLLISAILLICGTLVLLVLPKLLHKVAVVLITAFSIMFYAQNMFLNRGIATSDGSMVKWENLKSQIAINTVIWVVAIVIIVAVLLLLKDRTEKICMYIAGFGSVIQLVAFASVLITLISYGDTKSHYQLTDEGQFMVAGNDNIILLVLDSTASKFVYDEYVKNNELLDGFEDFTFYTNYDSNYRYTFPSMTHMLTGDEPDGLMTRQDWMAQAWGTEKCKVFFDKMHEADYVCNIFSNETTTVYGKGDNLQGKADNLEEVESVIDRRLLYVMLQKMSLYRVAPDILKKIVEVDMTHYRGVSTYDEIESAKYYNSEYIAALRENRLSINGEWNNAFIINHILGMHTPWEIDSDGNYKDLSEENDVLYGLFSGARDYIEYLKELGVYDNATIFVMADHGMPDDPDKHHSLFMVKEAGAHKDKMAVSDAPVSADDFQKTILETIYGNDAEDIFDNIYDENGNKIDFGTSIYEWHDGDMRERTTYDTFAGMIGWTYTGGYDEFKSTFEDGIDVEVKGCKW